MATANCTNQATATRPSRPMEFEPMWWGDYYNGTMPQLLDTGKFLPEWFPGMPGNKPTSKTMKGVEFEGRAIPELRIWRKDSSRRRFTVWVSIDEHEQALRRYQNGLQEGLRKGKGRMVRVLSRLQVFRTHPYTCTCSSDRQFATKTPPRCSRKSGHQRRTYLPTYIAQVSR